jgi:O-antigen/teichoic acid export membrane protein
MLILSLKVFALSIVGTFGVLFAVGFANALERVRKELRARDEKNNMG